MLIQGLCTNGFSVKELYSHKVGPGKEKGCNIHCKCVQKGAKSQPPAKTISESKIKA